MATTELKTLEKLIKEILEKVKNIDEQSSKESYNNAFDEINTKLDTIDERLVAPNTNESVSAELISKVDEINKKIEKKSKDYVKEIQLAFDNYKQNQTEILANGDIQNSDIKDFVSIITNELSELKEQFESFNTEFTDISINTNMAMSKEVVSLKNHVLSLNDSVDNIKNKIEVYNSENITNTVEEIYNSSFSSFKNDVYSVLAKITDASNDAVKKNYGFNRRIENL